MSRARTIGLTLVMSVAALLLFAACGGDDDSQATPEEIATVAGTGESGYSGEEGPRQPTSKPPITGNIERLRQAMESPETARYVPICAA